MQARGLDRNTRAFIAGVVAAGTLCVTLALTQGSAWIGGNPLVFIGITVGMFVAESVVITFAFRKESWAFSVVEIGITFGLLTLPAAPLVVSAALGLALAQIFRRRPPLKAAFNVAMYSVATSAAVLTFAAVEAASLAGPHRWLAAVLAMVAFYLVNQILLSLVVGLVGQQPLRDLVRVGGPMVGAVWLGGVGLGMLANHLAMTSPDATWLLVVPIVLAYLAYRGWIGSMEESRKMHDLYRAGSALVGSIEHHGGIEDFLQAIRDMFRASGSQVITMEGPAAFRIAKDDATFEMVEFSELGTALTPAEALDLYVASKSWDSHMLARLAGEIGITGALIVHDHVAHDGTITSFPDQNRELLQLLANQASIRIRNVTLFNTVSEEREKLSDIVEYTSDGIYQVSPDRRIMTWNPAMETITGFSAAEAVGQMCFNILRARDDRGVDMCSGDCPILAAGEHRCDQQREAQIMTKDGTVRWIEYSHSPIIGPEDRMTSDVIVVRDVTTQRAARELKDDFVATVSHELRTPLTPLKGFLLTLLRPDVQISEEDRTAFYTRMLHNTERLEHLVEDLLDVSRIEAGRLSVGLSTVNVRSLVHEMLDSFQAANPERRLTLQSVDQEVLARTNDVRLEQVLSNLVQNAIRYSPANEPIEVIIQLEGPEVVISVRDRGPGIPYDEQDKIFDRFYRLGHHLTREQPGTGLGLFIARRLTEAMSGKLTLSSRVGHGSTFSVHLPADQTSERMSPLD